MNPVTAINTVLAAINLVEQLIPVIKEMHGSGAVTPEQQAELMARLKSLREQTESQFSGPEWEIAP